MGGRKLNRLLCIAVLTFLTMISSAPIGFVQANAPSIKSVVAFDVDGNTHVYVAINHLGQNQTPYVNVITVDVTGVGQKDFQFGHQPTAPNGDVVYECDLGPIPEDRNAFVTANCLLHGPSLNLWSGVVPEFSVPILLLALATIAAGFTAYKAKRDCR